MNTTPQNLYIYWVILDDWPRCCLGSEEEDENMVYLRRAMISGEKTM